MADETHCSGCEPADCPGLIDREPDLRTERDDLRLRLGAWQTQALALGGIKSPYQMSLAFEKLKRERDELAAANEQLRSDMEEAQGMIENGGRAHDCAGWQCVECGASGAAGFLADARTKREPAENILLRRDFKVKAGECEEFLKILDSVITERKEYFARPSFLEMYGVRGVDQDTKAAREMLIKALDSFRHAVDARFQLLKREAQ